MLEPRDYLEMTFRSIQCFAKGATFGFGQALGYRLLEGRVPDFYAQVLSGLKKIIAQIKPEEIDQAMRDKLAEVAKKIGA